MSKIEFRLEDHNDGIYVRASFPGMSSRGYAKLKVEGKDNCENEGLLLAGFKEAKEASKKILQETLKIVMIDIKMEEEKVRKKMDSLQEEIQDINNALAEFR